MRIVRATRFGGPEVLEPAEAPEPRAEIGEVVIEVSVAAIDFVQTQLRRGFTPGPPLPAPPYVPGSSVGGRVSSVGQGADSGWIGRRVVAHTASGHGGSAERAVAEVGALIPVPPALGLAEAVALLDDGSTALGLVETAGVKAGDWVLVEAAGGGVGSLLVQLARASGARVIGAAGGALKLDLARRLGAEVVIDYSAPGWSERVLQATGGRGADVVFDGVGGQVGLAAFGATAAGGRFSVHGAASGTATAIDAAQARRHKVTVIGIEQLQTFGTGARARAERMLADAAAGRVRPVIGRTFPLERAAAAHAAMEARKVLGKTLLVIPTASPDHRRSPDHMRKATMPFTEFELEYLASQRLGRLATIQPDGTPQNSPVVFTYNAATQTIDIPGHNMATSRKFRNIASNDRVAFVVDDIASLRPWRVRCLEIRGHAEAIEFPTDSATGGGGAIIRVHPRRVISFGIDDLDTEPHDIVPSKRTIEGAGR